MEPATLIAGGSALLGFLGGERTNRSNRAEAERNRQFQSKEAATNRVFQERMRNTEWQAGVEDMRKAGINPAVAYARGGASSPSGAMGSGSQAAPAVDSVSSAMQGIRMKRELDMLSASIEKTSNEARAAGAIADREDARNKAYGFKRLPNGSVSIDMSMPGIIDETQAMIAERIANAQRAGSMAEISGLGGQVAGAFGEFMPALSSLARVGGQGASQLSGAIEMLERAARMRDDAVRAWLGFPKSVAIRMLETLRKGRN